MDLAEELVVEEVQDSVSGELLLHGPMSVEGEADFPDAHILAQLWLRPTRLLHRFILHE